MTLMVPFLTACRGVGRGKDAHESQSRFRSERRSGLTRVRRAGGGNQTVEYAKFASSHRHGGGGDFRLINRRGM